MVGPSRRRAGQDPAAFLVVVLLAGVLLAVLLDAEPLLAVVFEAVVRAAVFFAVDAVDVAAEVFLAAAFFAEAFLAGVLVADVLEAEVLEAEVLEADVLEADVLEADVLEAGVLEAVVLAGLDFDAVDRAADDDVVPAFLAGVVRLVVDFVVLVFLAAEDGALSAAVVALVAEVFLAVPVAARVVLAAAVKVSLGSFFAPDTTAFRSAPALNFGIAVFLALIRSPVRGLRTQRASRTRFSNEPKPVMATFSPLATSRVMVSITDSSAWAACLRLPS